jgi:hypothetical protein
MSHGDVRRLLSRSEPVVREALEAVLALEISLFHPSVSATLAWRARKQLIHRPYEEENERGENHNKQQSIEAAQAL